MKFLLSMYDVSILYTVAVASLVSVAIYTIDVTHAFFFFFLQTVIKVFFIYLNIVSGCSLVFFLFFNRGTLFNLHNEK